jgi:hypothetical protein
MNQEDKELLLKDLCTRLPYGVKCQYTCVVQEGTLVTGKSNWIGELKGIVPQRNGHIGFMVDCDKIDALEGDIKPYLRPMSSMTEKEKLMYEGLMIGTDNISYMLDIIDWLLKNHFDFRGLIPKGLAIEVTKENNPYES